MKPRYLSLLFYSVFALVISISTDVAAAGYNAMCVDDGGTNCPSGPGTISNASPVVSVISVPTGSCSKVLDVDVLVDITHTDAIEYSFDVSHNGINVPLYDQDCDGEENMYVVFDDSAGPMVCQTPISGTYRPAQYLPGGLPDFNGLSGDGDWSLTVTGDSSLDVGELNNWGLTITCDDPTPIPVLSWWGMLLLLGGLLLTAWLLLTRIRKTV